MKVQDSQLVQMQFQIKEKEIAMMSHNLAI